MTIVFLFMVSATFAQETKDTFVENDGKVEATYYHDNGIVKQHGFFNAEGKLDGEWTSYDVNGKKIAEGEYNNGLKTGKWFFWNAENTLTEVDYKDQKVLSVNTWKKEGLVSRE